MRIDEVMPTAIGEECPILGMENFEFDGMERSKKFAMNSASSTQNLVINRGRILIPISIPIPMASVAMLGEPYLVDYFGNSLGEGG